VIKQSVASNGKLWLSAVTAGVQKGVG